LPFRYGRFQPGLFLVIFGKKPGKMFVGYLARGVALREPLSRVSFKKFPQPSKNIDWGKYHLKYSRI
jgi:hypothetical protein